MPFRETSRAGTTGRECAGLNKTSELIPVVFDFEDFLDDPSVVIHRLPEKIKHM